MLQLPGKLTPADFLHDHWQKQPLFIAAGLQSRVPSLSRNELAWLATLDDVESRIIFTERSQSGCRYRAEVGPFEERYLQQLPRRDWTLLVHDVEKHLPAMRPLLNVAKSIPDWRIDDLMISFAAPGGSAGPHRDNYDVFLCQGIGSRRWHVDVAPVQVDPAASDDLALLREFDGTEQYVAQRGDVLYLPPGVAHWGIATRACMTYSIGMRAPTAADLLLDAAVPNASSFYRDPDLQIEEAVPGYIGARAADRALQLTGLPKSRQSEAAQALGTYATQCKDWLRPEAVPGDIADQVLKQLDDGKPLQVHGMSNIAYDDDHIYVNGRKRRYNAEYRAWLEAVCETRQLRKLPKDDSSLRQLLHWMVCQGAFESPENL